MSASAAHNSHSPPHTLHLTLSGLYLYRKTINQVTLRSELELTQGIFQTQIGFIAEELSTICFNDLFILHYNLIDQVALKLNFSQPGGNLGKIITRVNSLLTYQNN